MKTQHLFFASSALLVFVVLIIQIRQIHLLENTVNRLENNYSNLNINLTTSLTNLNSSLTTLNSNITNLNSQQIAESQIPISRLPRRIRASQSNPSLSSLFDSNNLPEPSPLNSNI